ncbi:MAG: DUF2304 domain-containing protein [Candidatus Hodarchaeota archaeon]
MTERLIPFRLQLFAITLSVLLLVGIIALIRKGKLKEGYSILWFAIGVGFLVISVWTSLLRLVSKIVDVEYEPATLFALLLIGSIVVMIHFTVIISGFDHKNKTLAQCIGLLTREIKKLKQENEEIKNQLPRMNNASASASKQDEKNG